MSCEWAEKPLARTADSTEVQEFREAAKVATERLADYLERSARGEGPAIGYRPIRDILAELTPEKWIREGGMDPGRFGDFLDSYLEHTTRLHHPGVQMGVAQGEAEAFRPGQHAH